jgi:predicted acylesterase/phospholipase RssA
MSNFWRSSTKDKVKNGFFAGGLMGLAVVFGERIFNFIANIMPNNWFLFGDITPQIFIVIAFAILGFIFDKY